VRDTDQTHLNRYRAMHKDDTTVIVYRVNITSSSAITERLRCRVGQFWPKVEDDIVQKI